MLNFNWRHVDWIRTLFISDMHCGGVVGLTHPDWELKPNRGWSKRRHAQYRHRRECWDIFEETVTMLRPDVVLNCGDTIDGKGERSGGTEQLTTDRNEQIQMAVDAVRTIDAPHMASVYGTGYHVGKDEDWEDQFASKMCSTIGGEDNAYLNGKVINYRHYLGGSSTPHTRGTALSKEDIWNQLWAARGEFPRAHVIARGHNHFFYFGGDANSLLFSLPALCGYGSKFGTRICSGTVDFGLVWLDIPMEGKIEWDWKIHRFVGQSDFALELSQ